MMAEVKNDWDDCCNKIWKMRMVIIVTATEP